MWIFLQDGGTPLFVACQCNHQEVVDDLLNRGADLHAQMVDGATPLFITAQNGHVKLMKYLISKGSEVNSTRQVCLWFLLTVFNITYHYILLRI